MASKRIINLETGEDVIVPLTPEEEADAAARTAAEAQAASIPPSTVTMRQARLALLQAGLLPAVEAAVAQAGPAAQIEWEYSSEVHRDKLLVQTLAPALNLSEAQLDDLFTLAATL